MIRGSTKVVGILGQDISYTLSPRMHNRAFERLGLDFVYVPFEVPEDRVPEAVEAVRALGLKGVNVTVPHKRAVFDYFRKRNYPLDKDAVRIGAVNTIVRDGGRLSGHNTDGKGFLLALREHFEPRGRRTVIAGAGGSACAVADALAGAGVSSLVVANRTASRARDLARRLRKHFPKVGVRTAELGALGREIGQADLLVDTVRTGLSGIAERLPASALARVFVYDLIYGRETALLKAARRAGARRTDGLGMLAYQGALAFRLWTGKKPPVRLMKEALKGIG